MINWKRIQVDDDTYLVVIYGDEDTGDVFTYGVVDNRETWQQTSMKWPSMVKFLDDITIVDEGMVGGMGELQERFGVIVHGPVT